MAKVTSFPKEFDMKNERQPMIDLILRMLKKTDGNVNQLRRKFVRRAKNGCPKSSAYLQLLDEHETAEKQRILEIVDKMEEDMQTRISKQKKKFSYLYPPVNI